MDWAGALSRFNNIVSDPNRWNTRVRIGFWVFGALAGGILAYTTRHYVNGDAIAYLDMAEAFREGLWNEAVLLGYSPGYSILLALFEYIFPTTSLNELFTVKFFNFVIFLAAMGACDFFVHRLTDEIQVGRERGPLPSHVIKASLEGMLDAELTEHLGYEKYSPIGKNNGNSRNGKTHKTVWRSLDIKESCKRQQRKDEYQHVRGYDLNPHPYQRRNKKDRKNQRFYYVRW